MFNASVVRRFLVERQSLAARADASPAELVGSLEAVQIDPVNLVARNHDLVFFNRLQDHAAGCTGYYLGVAGVFEYIAGNRALLPLADYPLFVPAMRRREERHRENLRRLAGPIRHVLAEIERRGPLTSRQIAWADKIHGYWDGEEPRTKETAFALHILWECGRLAVAGRKGAEILYDLPERVLPASVMAAGRGLDPGEARRLLRYKYYRSMGVFDPDHTFFGWQRMPMAERRAVLAEDERAGLIEPLVIEGVGRPYWAVAGAAVRMRNIDDGDALEEVRFLSPLDNLLWRRERIEDLFGFAYRWEIYQPAKKRKGGAYTMPILAGTSLVGRLDARMDRKAGKLVVEKLAYEPGFKPSRALREKVREELERLEGFCLG